VGLVVAASLAGQAAKACPNCKEAIEAQGDVGACLDQHMAELSEACKTKREAKAKKPENETQTEPNQGATPQ